MTTSDLEFIRRQLVNLLTVVETMQRNERSSVLAERSRLRAGSPLSWRDHPIFSSDDAESDAAAERQRESEKWKDE